MAASDGMQRVAVLGSTGSIGTSCLDVLDGMRDTTCVAGLTAHRRWRDLQKQVERFQPRRVVISDASLAGEIPRSAFGPGTDVVFGESGIERLAADPEVDMVVAGIVGAAGLRGTWAAIETGKRIGLANKETLVVAGPLVMELARQRGATIVPVDSEHSAVFQAMQSGTQKEVKRIVLTASGGPFRTWTEQQLRDVTPKQASSHPTWNMGPKITVDSANLMNKALEVIEARWLFDLRPDQIEVVVHPQSIIHSFVEFVDGSVIAQLSPPDMKLPIQYALTYPARIEGIAPKLDWKKTYQLEFSPPDLDRFPALGLGFEVARRGGTSGAVLNAANEVAVERFLAGQLSFCDIHRACRAVLESHHYDPAPTLTELFRQDAWAREEMRQWRS